MKRYEVMKLLEKMLTNYEGDSIGINIDGVDIKVKFVDDTICFIDDDDGEVLYQNDDSGNKFYISDWAMKDAIDLFEY